jgi:uncharacterized protein (TIGR00251 family)
VRNASTPGGITVNLSDYVKNKTLKILVKPNSPKTEIVKWDKDRGALRVNVAAPPEKDKANKELIKFFSKQLKKKISIISGAKSKEKLLRVD